MPKKGMHSSFESLRKQRNNFEGSVIRFALSGFNEISVCFNNLKSESEKVNQRVTEKLLMALKQKLYPTIKNFSLMLAGPCDVDDYKLINSDRQLIDYIQEIEGEVVCCLAKKSERDWGSKAVIPAAQAALDNPLMQNANAGGGVAAVPGANNQPGGAAAPGANNQCGGAVP